MKLQIGLGFLNEMDISILIVHALVLMNQNTIWIISITDLVPYEPTGHNIIYVDSKPYPIMLRCNYKNIANLRNLMLVRL